CLDYFCPILMCFFVDMILRPDNTLIIPYTTLFRSIDDVITQGRAEFTEGSDSYDRATVAILRLAALFESDERFGELLRVVTLEERRGIITTRNIAAHSGCGAMNTEIFWRTVTERLPEVIARIRATDRN